MHPFLPVPPLALASLLAALTLPAAPRAGGDEEPFHTLEVGIVVHEGVEVLDFTGPAEVFDSAGHSLSIGGHPLFEVVTVAPRKGTVHAHGGVAVEPRFTIADAPPLDLLVVPGGQTGVLTSDPAFMKWLGETAPKCRVVLSVCTGAFALAQAGLLDGGEATTFHGALEGLRQSAPKAKVLSGRRVVDNGRIVTAGGVSCGIDGALHVVARLGGRRLADSVAGYMEFRWQPEPALEGAYSPYCALGGRRTSLLQELRVHRGAKEFAAAEKLARELVALDATDGEAWYELGYALLSQDRVDDSILANEHAEQAAPSLQRTTAIYNLACAWARKGEKEKALAAFRRAVDAGFRNRAYAEEDADLAGLRGDQRFRELLREIDAARPAARDGAER